MNRSYTVQCQNCGAVFTPVLPKDLYSNEVEYSCPVCHYDNTATELSNDTLTPLTEDELGNQLSMFMHQVRMAGLSADTIVLVLSRELEFAAELAHPGRHLYVQLIDLGSQDFEVHVHPAPDQRDVLQTRYVGQ